MNQLLREKTEDAVKGKLDSQDSFTTTDISNAVKQAVYAINSKVPGHRQVRPIIEELEAEGMMANADFVATPITVYPNGKPFTVRLWHHHAVDPADYRDVNQIAWTPTTGQSTADLVNDAGRQVDMDGPDTNDSMPVIQNTPSGATVQKQCQLQLKQSTLNLPLILVKAAGMFVGNSILVASNSKGGIDIKRSITGTQEVDAQGRIRIHGRNLEMLKKGKGDPCTAMLVEDGGEKYIVVQ